MNSIKIHIYLLLNFPRKISTITCITEWSKDIIKCSKHKQQTLLQSSINSCTPLSLKCSRCSRLSWICLKRARYHPNALSTTNSYQPNTAIIESLEPRLPEMLFRPFEVTIWVFRRNEVIAGNERLFWGNEIFQLLLYLVNLMYYLCPLGAPYNYLNRVKKKKIITAKRKLFNT